MRKAPSIQRCFRVKDVLAFILQCPRPPAYNEPDCLAIAKTLSRRHADGQLRSEHTQVGANFLLQNLPKLEIAQFAQPLAEHAG